MNRFPARSPHLRRDCAHPATSALRLGLTPATSVPRLGSPLPHLHRDWAHPYAQRSHPHFSPARCHGSAHTHAARRQAAEAGCDSRTHAHAVQAQMWAGASPVPAQMCQRQASPPSDMRMMSRIAPRASSVELMYLRQVPAQMWPLRSWADVAEKGAYVEFRAKKTEPFAYLTHDRRGAGANVRARPCRRRNPRAQFAREYSATRRPRASAAAAVPRGAVRCRANGVRAEGAGISLECEGMLY